LPSAENIGIVVLAAGASRRLGEPKQLLEYNGEFLLLHVITEALNSNASPVIVILGSNADSISKKIDKKNVEIVENKEWEEGMASSVRLGLSTLNEKKPDTDAVIFTVCDQPYISSSILNELINTYHKSGKKIVACNYGDSTGPPSLFDKTLFPELMQLKGDAGAKKIIQHHINEAAIVQFPEGKFDIDTREDYNNIVNGK
jgi:molybdenum cofactor cytidylyltransferase